MSGATTIGVGADELYVHVVPARGPLRARVAAVHGFAEHGGRYLELASTLADRGIEVHLLDLHGHGRSPGVRALMTRESELIEAIVALLERLRDDDEVPVGLFGHSFGGALALRTAQLRPDLPYALVATGPFLISGRRDPAWLVKVARWASYLVPWLRTVPLDSGTVTNLSDQVRAYDEDPLVDRGGVRLGSARVMYGVGPKVLADARKLVTPTLLIHGSEDRLADPEGSRQLYLRAEGLDVELREIPGVGHAVLHDEHAERIREGIAEWLDLRLGVRAGADDASAG